MRLFVVLNNSLQLVLYHPMLSAFLSTTFTFSSLVNCLVLLLSGSAASGLPCFGLPVVGVGMAYLGPYDSNRMTEVIV